MKCQSHWVVTALFVVALGVPSLPVHTLSIDFKFTDDPTNLTPIFRGTHLPGEVTGTLFGFTDNISNQLPTAMIITSDMSGLGMTDTAFNSFTDFTSNGFDIFGGVVTDVSLFFNFVDTTAGRMQIRFNFDQQNIVMWNGINGESFATTPIADIGNEDGFSGAIYTSSSVPIPAAFWLFGSGLIGLLGLARRPRA